MFVNELNHHAMETYLLNRDGATSVDLRDPDRHVNDVVALSQDPDALRTLGKLVRKQHGELTLLVGGPPCQGFSGIGHRRTFDLHKDDTCLGDLFGWQPLPHK